MLASIFRSRVGRGGGGLILLVAWTAFFYSIHASSQASGIFAYLHIPLWQLFAFGPLYLALSYLPASWLGPEERTAGPRREMRVAHLLAALLPMLLFWALYHRVLKGWWTFDDPYFLNYVDMVGPLAAFYDPSRAFVWYNPLSPLSWWIDYYLFGLDPTGFYWHHLLSFSIVVALAYRVLALFFAPLLSSIIVSLFVLSVPSAEAAHYMMVRHYVEGLALTLLAIWAYVHANRSAKWGWAIAGSLFYFGATVAKEFYVPLVVVLPWLSLGPLKRRLQLLVPYTVVAVLYTAIRFYMLGEKSLSAYGERSTTWGEVLRFPLTFAHAMGWTEPWQWVPVVGLLVVLVWMILRRPLSFGVPVGIWLGAIFIPLIPVIWRISHLYYYLFMPALIFWVAAGLALRHLSTLLEAFDLRRLVLVGGFFLLFAANMMPVQTNQWRYRTHGEIMEIYGKFLLEADLPHAVLIHDYHVLENLVYVREKILNKKGGVGYCRQDDCTCALRYPGYRAYQYRGGKWQSKTLLLDDCGEPRPLSVQVVVDEDLRVSWKLGPYGADEGQYSVWMSTTAHSQYTVIPPEGSGTLSKMPGEAVSISITFRSSEGWETYSPALVFDPTQGQKEGASEIRWQRP
jgi:hypothetical protein